ncbi:MAG: transcriptional regulator, partial [Haliea sp.]
MQDLGAVLFDGLSPVPVGDAMLDTVLARLDEEPPLSYRRADDLSLGRMPAVLQRLMRGDFTELVWKKVTSSLRISYLKTGDPGFEFALYHIKAGGRIPEHNHRGSEMTLVLQGGFS